MERNKYKKKGNDCECEKRKGKEYGFQYQWIGKGRVGDGPIVKIMVQVFLSYLWGTMDQEASQRRRRTHLLL